MANPKRGWLTPDEPTSETNECRLIFIPDNEQFVGAVNGALLELTKAYNWEQFGTMTAEDAAAVMYEMWIDYIASSCSARVARGYRVNPNGEVEWTDNGGASWTNADADVWETTPAREEPTADDRRCLAAANAANVLQQVYIETLVAYAEDNDVLFGAAFLGSIIGLLFLGLVVPVSGIAVINTLIAFTLEAFAAGWWAMEFLEDDDWTVEYNDFIVCLLYEHSSDDAGVVTFDFDAVRDNLINGEVDAAVTIWNYYILSVVGAEGLNNAGTTTAIEDYDCNECDDCLCHNFDFTVNDAGFSILAGRGGGRDEDGFYSIYNFGGLGNSEIRITRTLDVPLNITRVEIDYIATVAPSNCNTLDFEAEWTGESGTMVTAVIEGEWYTNEMRTDIFVTGYAEFWIKAIRLYNCEEC